MKMGKGEIKLPNGYQISGNWVDDELHGPSIITSADGQVTHMNWHRNVMMPSTGPRVGGTGGSDR